MARTADVILAIWILWGIVFLPAGPVVKAVEWGGTYFVVTSQRLVLSTASSPTR